MSLADDLREDALAMLALADALQLRALPWAAAEARRLATRVRAAASATEFAADDTAVMPLGESGCAAVTDPPPVPAPVPTPPIRRRRHL